MSYNPVPKLTNGNATFDNDVNVSGLSTAGSGLLLVDLVPGSTTNKLYNDGGTLKFNGSSIGGGGGSATGIPSGVGFFDDSGSLSGNTSFTFDGQNITVSGYIDASGERVVTSEDIHHIVQLTQAEYDALTPDSATFYIITDAPSISGYFESRVDSADSSITANSGYFETRVDQNAADIITVSGLTGGGGGSYTAGSGLTLVGSEFNVYGGSGNFEYVELTTDSAVVPTFKYQGSGVTDTAINLEVRSSFQSATGSGTALLFQGTQGQLFSITDNLSSGTIFNVSDITGLPMLEVTASGDVEIGEFADNITIHQPVLLSGGVPSNTTNKLYNNAGSLYFNGSAVGGGSSYTAGSGLTLVGTEFNVYGGSGHFDQILFHQENVQIGTDSQAISSGISIGYQAGSGYLGGNPNMISIGTKAGAEAWTATTDGIFVGYEAGYDSFGSYGFYGGYQAGKNQYATNSVFIGRWAGYASAWQSSNNSYNSVGVGPYALLYAVGAINDICFGFEAGRSMTGDSNFAVGQQAGYNITGDNNIEIRMGKTGASIIGSNSDKLHIQETIIGDTSSKLLAIGNVGSADLTPDATLEVKPNATTDVGIIVQAVASHSVNLQEWQDSSEVSMLAVGPDGGLEIPNNVPATTTNKLYNNAGTLTFNGSAVGGSSYTAGSGLTLVGSEFNVYGGSGNFENIDLTTDAAVVPKMVFTGSGVTDTPIRMKVLSSHASASTSGTALAFEGTEGQLFGITDNLSSGKIFSVNDITGLPLISADASGDVELAEFGRDIIAHKAITLQSGVPSVTTNKLYNDGYNLYYNGSTVGYDDTAISGYFESRVDQADSDIASTSGYFEDNILEIVGVSGIDVTSAGSTVNISAGSLSGYFESRVDSADSSITANSGYFESRVDSADSSITANSGYFESRVDTNAADIVVVSGLTGGGGAVSAVANGANNRVATFSSADALNGEANLTFDGSTLAVNGAFTATTKSFLVDHPSKEGMKLQYASLEGPENGVYVRGTTDEGFITLPDYWRDLVHNSSITVTLTPVGQFQPLFVEQKNNREIRVGGVCGYYDYVVYGERKDVDKLEVEW